MTLDQRLLYGFIPDEVSPPEGVWDRIRVSLDAADKHGGRLEEMGLLAFIGETSGTPVVPTFKKGKVLKLSLAVAVAASVAVFVFSTFFYPATNGLGEEMTGVIPVVLTPSNNSVAVVNNNDSTSKKSATLALGDTTNRSTHNGNKIDCCNSSRNLFATGSSSTRKRGRIFKKLTNVTSFYNDTLSAITQLQPTKKYDLKQLEHVSKEWKFRVVSTRNKPIVTNFADPINLLCLHRKEK